MARKSQTKKTIKKLFALSGNLCAFPGCQQNIFDKQGNLIGEICHIEAAEKGGERFNLHQNDEERNSFENLILLCANHHRVTNNTEIYTVDQLRKMKLEHETKYFNKQYLVSDEIIEKIIHLEPHVFKPFQYVKKVIYNDLFKKNLLYFTSQDKQTIEEISIKLVHNKKALLVGFPGTGKSILAMSVANYLEKQGYRTYRHSFQNKRVDESELWDDINLLIHEKVLYVLDDCHLDVEAASQLFYRFDTSNSVAGLLFISRIIPSSLQLSTNEEINIFKELKEYTFKNEKLKIENKIKGIIKKYQRYYENKNDRSYIVGNINLIQQNVRRNLVALSAYLDIWEDSGASCLSDIGTDKMLEKVYEKTFQNKLTEKEIECLLLYISLFIFEIAFEAPTKYYKITKSLAKKGIIVETEDFFYSFDHGETASLLLEAHKEHHGSRFTRKHGSTNNFLFEQIKKYILSIAEEYQYPTNLHTIFMNLLTNQKISMFEKLITEKSLKKIVLNFYGNDEIKEDLLYAFLRAITKHVSSYLNPYFEKLILNDKRDLFLSSNKAVYTYVYILKYLSKNQESFDRFSANWQEGQEQILFRNASIFYIGRDLYYLSKISKTKARNIYSSLEAELLTKKVEEANLSYLVIALKYLKDIDYRKTSKLFRETSNKILLTKFENEDDFSKLVNYLNKFYTIDSDKTIELCKELIMKHHPALHNIPKALINNPDLITLGVANILFEQLNLIDKSAFETIVTNLVQQIKQSHIELARQLIDKYELKNKYLIEILIVALIKNGSERAVLLATKWIKEHSLEGKFPTEMLIDGLIQNGYPNSIFLAKKWIDDNDLENRFSIETMIQALIDNCSGRSIDLASQWVKKYNLGDKFPLFHERLKRKVEIGDTVECIVTNIIPNRVFVRIANSINTGSIHISQLDKNMIKQTSEEVPVGQKLKAKVIGYYEKHKNYILSVKEVSAQ